MQIDGKHYTMSLRMMKAVWYVIQPIPTPTSG